MIVVTVIRRTSGKLVRYVVEFPEKVQKVTDYAP